MSITDLTLVNEEYENKMVAFEMDCNDGKGTALPCHQVGEFFSVVKDDFARSSAIYRKNCEQKGYPPSCFNLGRLIMAGKGVPQSDSQATKYFSKACKEGHYLGCYTEAIMLYSPYDRADGSSEKIPKSADKIAKDKVEAMRILEFACDGGETESCYFAAGHHIAPTAVPRNPAKGMEYLKRACAANHGPSCYNLAIMFKKGDDGVPADEKEYARYRAATEELVKQYGGKLQGVRK